MSEILDSRLDRLNTALRKYRAATEHVIEFWRHRHLTYELRGSGTYESIYIFKGGLTDNGKDMLTIESSENKAIAYVQKWYANQIGIWNDSCLTSDSDDDEFTSDGFDDGFDDDYDDDYLDYLNYVHKGIP